MLFSLRLRAHTHTHTYMINISPFATLAHEHARTQRVWWMGGGVCWLARVQAFESTCTNTKLSLLHLYVLGSARGASAHETLIHLSMTHVCNKYIYIFLCTFLRFLLDTHALSALSFTHSRIRTQYRSFGSTANTILYTILYCWEI